MTTLSYSFRPSFFAKEHTLALDAAGLRLRVAGAGERRLAFGDVTDMHIQAVARGEDSPAWRADLRGKDGTALHLTSIDVRGPGKVADKGAEFAALIEAIHAGLLPRAGEVRFRFGIGRGMTLAWRAALVLCVLAGLAAAAAAVYLQQWSMGLGAVALLGTGLSGLWLLRGRGGPRPYDPARLKLPTAA